MPCWKQIRKNRFWNCHKSKWYIHVCFTRMGMSQIQQPSNSHDISIWFDRSRSPGYARMPWQSWSGKSSQTSRCFDCFVAVGGWTLFDRESTHFCISGSTCQRIRRAIRWQCLHSEHKRCEAQINIDSCVQNCPKDKRLETLSPTVDCRMLCGALVTSILWKPRALGFHAHPVQWDHRRCRQRWNWSACTSAFGSV